MITLFAVKVSSPWEEATFIPQDSNSISVSCSKQNEEGQNMLEWSIRLPDRQVDDSFAAGIREEILNNRGFYKLRSLRNGTLRVIRLAINNTEGINGTMLKCVDIISGNLLEDTTIVVYG